MPWAGIDGRRECHLLRPPWICGQRRSRMCRQPVLAWPPAWLTGAHAETAHVRGQLETPSAPRAPCPCTPAFVFNPAQLPDLCIPAWLSQVRGQLQDQEPPVHHPGVHGERRPQVRFNSYPEGRWFLAYHRSLSALGGHGEQGPQVRCSGANCLSAAPRFPLPTSDIKPGLFRPLNITCLACLPTSNPPTCSTLQPCSSVIKASKFGPFPESLVAVYIQQVLQASSELVSISRAPFVPSGGVHPASAAGEFRLSHACSPCVRALQGGAGCCGCIRGRVLLLGRVWWALEAAQPARGGRAGQLPARGQ